MPVREVNPADRDAHWAGWQEYAGLEMDLGGPDPQVTLVCHMIRQGTEDPVERAWRAGCYLSTYTVAGGELFWTVLPVTACDERIRATVDTLWPYLAIKQERRAVKSRGRMAEYLCSYRDWVHRSLYGADRLDYEQLWTSARRGVRYAGRYATIKLLEVLRRVGVVTAAMPDLRPDGAWSPRLTLSWLRPDRADALNGGNDVQTLAAVNEVAHRVRLDMADRMGRDLDPFTFEVLCCNYRQALRDKYPGRGHDSELGHYLRTVPYWDAMGGRSAFFESRLHLWDTRCLGEVRGWDGVRKELGETRRRFGYFWSDLRFDYTRTVDLASPVGWEP